MPPERDPLLRSLEIQVRQAIQDALNRPSRKPFQWGGWEGYRQLAALDQALAEVPEGAQTRYLRRLGYQVHRAVEAHQGLAEDLAQAHQGLEQIARGLQYPPRASGGPALPRGSSAVRAALEALLAQAPRDLRRCPAQSALWSAARRLWRRWGPDLLHCYEVPGLPPDNLALEALFGRLRRHQRRLSGQRSTRPLRDFGPAQVLFQAESEADLLAQLRVVSLAEYRKHRQQLAQAEAPRQGLCRLHRDPVKTLQRLLAQHAARREALVLPAGCLLAHTA